MGSRCKAADVIDVILSPDVMSGRRISRLGCWKIHQAVQAGDFRQTTRRQPEADAPQAQIRQSRHTALAGRQRFVATLWRTSAFALHHARRRASGLRMAFLISLFVIATLFTGCVVSSDFSQPSVAALPQSEFKLESTDRILIFSPHPDDETLGCSGIIQQAVAMKLPVRVVFLTYGDFNQWSFVVYRKRPVLLPGEVERMAGIRHDEALAAGKVMGLAREQLTFLGYPDFGTFQMWCNHWGHRPPYRSLLTRVNAVPYKTALRPGAPYRADEVLRDLTAVLREFRPTKIFVTDSVDQHPDHHAFYLYTCVALWDLEKEMKPGLHPFLIHYLRWPTPRGWQPADPLELPRRLSQQMSQEVFRLTPAQIERKLQALEAHRTQYECDATYLSSFIRSNELFGDFPPILLNVGMREMVLPDSTKDSAILSDYLLDEERAYFVGIEEQSVSLEDDEIVVTVHFSRPLAEAVKLSVYLFGYRTDQPFAGLPKLHVQFGAGRHRVLNQNQRFSAQGIEVSRKPQQITVRVPLRTLGNPERVLMGTRTYLGELPLDWAPWRVVEVRASGDRVDQ